MWVLFNFMYMLHKNGKCISTPFHDFLKMSHRYIAYASTELPANEDK